MGTVIGMHFAGELAIRALDLIGGRRLRNPKIAIVKFIYVPVGSAKCRRIGLKKEGSEGFERRTVHQPVGAPSRDPSRWTHEHRFHLLHLHHQRRRNFLVRIVEELAGLDVDQQLLQFPRARVPSGRCRADLRSR